LSDVKIGCQLSGGIDSSLITLLTSENLKDYDLNSISIILKDQKYSEEKWIDIVSEKTNVTSHKYQLDGAYFAENFKKAIWHFDFPLLVPNSLGIYMLAEKAKEFFTVFLSGEGADEMFGGYKRFYLGNVINKYWGLLKNMPVLNKRLYNWCDGNKKNFSAVDWYIAITTQLSPSNLKLIKPDINFELSMSKRKAIFNSGNGDFIHKSQRYELKTWLVDLLMRQDKMTMAHSVENRVPFLDHNIVDFARKLPSDYLAKIGLNNNKNTKIILKKISEKHFGKEFTYRKKMGFELPLVELFKNKEFYGYVQDIIIPGIKTRGLYDWRILKKYFDNLEIISQQDAYVAWTLVCFEAWGQMYLDGGFEFE
jgi:asparagine synthase (glutamine-hydrolysing)